MNENKKIYEKYTELQKENPKLNISQLFEIISPTYPWLDYTSFITIINEEKGQDR